MFKPLAPRKKKKREGEVTDGERRILSLLKSRFQIDLGQYKLTTVRRRLERRMALDGAESLERYAGHLKGNPAALQALHDDLFIHVTGFFRDPEAFEALARRVVPALLENRPVDQPVRVWIPGCSSGEEAYSLAMVLTEALEKLDERPRLQLFATDVSEVAVEHARRGLYPPEAMKPVSPQRLERFFERTADGFKVKKDLRELCIISRHDITTQPPFARLDLISCRNVLIYFGAELQQRILGIFHYALKPEGFLWLGQSETPGTSSRLFNLVDKAHKLYSKVAAPRLQLVDRDFRIDRLQLPGAHPRELKAHLDRADQLVLARFAPPGVVVNHELEILQFRGRTTPWLEPAAGQPTTHVLKLAHPSLLPALRTLLQVARKTNRTARKEKVALDSRRSAGLEVSPLNPGAPEAQRQYLVLFDALPRTKGPPTPVPFTPRARSKLGGAQGELVASLKSELEMMKEQQQSLIEQAEAMQEELTSANEELQATNEEFQSTNEELETAKEELQASNEELTSLNEELVARNAELEQANDKLVRGENRFRMMVEGVKDYAIYMLDPEGRVTSWNEGARRLKGYEAAEILGKNYASFFSPEEVQSGDPAHELETARVEGRFEAEGWRVRKDGTRFWASVVMTRINDSSGKLIGFSKVTRDLTERMKAAEALRRMNETLEARVKERTADLALALKSRDEFLSIASHELKTPVTALKLKLQLGRRSMLRDGQQPTSEALRAAFDQSLKQLGTLEELIEDLLDISRIQTGQLQLEVAAVDVPAMVREVWGRFTELAANAGVRGTLDLEDEVTAQWDRRRIDQVLSNLIANALKYAPDSDLRLSAAARDGVVNLTVEDTGPGIPKDRQHLLFERFERAGASPSVGGLGLGLFIARRIVEAHQGTVRVESAAGQGARFCIELPQVPHIV
jgi:two-component system, chemotaxis family, CheB/CheR fusion protein